MPLVAKDYQVIGCSALFLFTGGGVNSRHGETTAGTLTSHSTATVTVTRPGVRPGNAVCVGPGVWAPQQNAGMGTAPGLNWVFSYPQVTETLGS